MSDKAAGDGSPEEATGSVIGPTVRLTGDLTGTEDLFIEGSVSGTVAHRNHVTIRPQGHLNGRLLSRQITIEGSVDGDLSAIEVVVVRNTAKLKGNVSGAEIRLDKGTKISGVVLNGRIGML